MRRVLSVAGLAVALAAIPASPCWACRCVMQTPRQHGANADVVFTGRVLGAEDPFQHSGPRVQAEFAVENVYKGSVGPEAVVETYPGGTAACGVAFAAGDRYTVFAFVNERSRLETNLCSGTTAGGIDPARFGLAVEEAAPDDQGNPWLAIVAPIGAVVLVATVGLAARRSRRSAPGA